MEQPDAPAQFTLRGLFLVTAGIACAIGLYAGIGSYAASVKRQAIRNGVVRKAFQEGRLSKAEADDILGYEFTP